MSHPLPKLSLTAKVVFGMLFAVAAYSLAIRFIYGLGGATNLTDRSPWGLWVGLDILTGVALAAGGFLVSAGVYIFGLEKYRPILKPALLTAFLGYLFFVIGLLVELGRPWAIWHAIVYWNPHSALFEVAWCVMLYTTVLALEISTLFFEKFRWVRLQKAYHAVVVVLVILGVMFSCLHQSSLGTLFVIAPGKVHPLWYSGILPIQFLASAMAAGLAMVIVESWLSDRFLGHALRMDLMQGISKVMLIALIVVTHLRVADLVTRGAWRFAFQPTPEAGLFWAEFLLFNLVPFMVLATARRRAARKPIVLAAASAVTGLVLHRLNVAITSLEHTSGWTYYPSWMEVVVTVALVAAGLLAFRFMAGFTPLFESEQHT